MTDIAKRFWVNGLLSAIVFLPSFLILSWLQGVVVDGWPSNKSVVADISAALFFYVYFIVPVILGSVVYTIVSFFVPGKWSAFWRRSIAIVLALLVPGIDLVFKIAGDRIYESFLIPMVIAAVLYGILSHIGPVRANS
jgi:hypothetical protein